MASAPIAQAAASTTSPEERPVSPPCAMLATAARKATLLRIRNQDAVVMMVMPFYVSECDWTGEVVGGGDQEPLPVEAHLLPYRVDRGI